VFQKLLQMSYNSDCKQFRLTGSTCIAPPSYGENSFLKRRVHLIFRPFRTPNEGQRQECSI